MIKSNASNFFCLMMHAMIFRCMPRFRSQGWYLNCLMTVVFYLHWPADSNTYIPKATTNIEWSAPLALRPPALRSWDRSPAQPTQSGLRLDLVWVFRSILHTSVCGSCVVRELNPVFTQIDRALKKLLLIL
jgi:hypothetical protein